MNFFIKCLRSILLATTYLIFIAGIASAEITWTGTATAGIARDGKVAASAGSLTDAELIAAVAQGAVGAAAVVVTINGNASTTALPVSGIASTSLTAITVKAYRIANAVAIAAAKEIAVKDALVAAVDATSLEVRKNAAMKAFIAANSAWDGSATVNGASSLTLTFTDSAGAAVTFYT